jgi:hypothetical protein
VAVPRHDSARLDHQLTNALHASFSLDGFLAEVVRRQYGVGDAGRLEVDRFADIGLDLICRALACIRLGHKSCRAENETGKRRGSAQMAGWDLAEHVGGSYETPPGVVGCTGQDVLNRSPPGANAKRLCCR